MGASAVGDIAALAALVRPQVGIITNAAPAHLERFGSLAGIIAGQGRVARRACRPTAWPILNHDSAGFDAWRARARCRVVSFGTTGGDHRWAWRPGDGDPAGWLDLDGTAWPVPLPGRHNAANLAAAVLAARALGLADDRHPPRPRRASAPRRIAARCCGSAGGPSWTTATTPTP